MDAEVPQDQPPLSERGGPLVYILNWFLLVVIVCAIAARLLAKWTLKKPFGSDDVLALGSLILSIASAITVAFQVSNGLGVPGDGARLGALLKCIYAFELLFIGVVWLAKMSIITLLLVLSPIPGHRYLILATGVTISVWATVSEFAVAFQCRLPEPWDYIGRQCIDKTVLWYWISALNIATDLALVCIPFIIVRTLQMRTRKKMVVLMSFGTRLVDIAAAGTQIAYTPVLNLSDTTQGLWVWVVILQVIQCVSIITSSLPYLRQLIEIIPSGMYTSDEIRRRFSFGFSAGRAPGSRSYSSVVKELDGDRAFKEHTVKLSNLDPRAGQHITTVAGGPGSSNVSGRSDTRFITATTTFGITSETAP